MSFTCGWHTIFDKIETKLAIEAYSCREIASSRAKANMQAIFRNQVLKSLQESYPDISTLYNACEAQYLESIFDSIKYTCHTYSSSISHQNNQCLIDIVQQRYPTIKIERDVATISLQGASEGAVLKGGPEVMHAFYWYQLFCRGFRSREIGNGATLDDLLAWATVRLDRRYKDTWLSNPSDPFEWGYCISRNHGPLSFVSAKNFTRPKESLYSVYEYTLRQIFEGMK
jgi:hypothetical protein